MYIRVHEAENDRDGVGPFPKGNKRHLESATLNEYRKTLMQALAGVTVW